jgi:hypothetical protein
VRRCAATVRFRNAGACPTELAELSEAEAGKLEAREGEGA